MQLDQLRHLDTEALHPSQALESGGHPAVEPLVRAQIESCLEVEEVQLQQLLQKAAILWEAISQLAPSIRLNFRPLCFALLLLCLNGCMSMHRPDYADSLNSSSYHLTEGEMTARQRQFSQLIADPSSAEKTPALQSGINDCQRTRMLESSAFLFEEAVSNDFTELINTFRRAKNTLGIMNFDRYSPRMIQIALENYENPELHRERPVILVVMSREDHEQTVLDIQALNVESGRIEELTKAYKVILVETSQMSELRHHVRHLEERGILRPGNLQGVLFGTHAEADEMEAGVDRENAHQLARLNRFLMGPDHSSIVLAACLTHEGGHEAYNIANVLAMTFPRARVAASPERVVGVDFRLDAAGRFIRSSLELDSIRGVLTLGLIDDTTWVSRTGAQTHHVARIRPELDASIPLAYIRRCVAAGILDHETIATLHGCTHGSGPSGSTSPEDFRRIMDVFPTDSHRWQFIRSGMPLETAEHFRRLGFEGFSEMKSLHDRNVTPQEVETFITAAVEQGVERDELSVILICLLSNHGVPLQMAIPYLREGISNTYLIQICAQNGIPAHLANRYIQSGFQIPASLGSPVVACPSAPRASTD